MGGGESKDWRDNVLLGRRSAHFAKSDIFIIDLVSCVPVHRRQTALSTLVIHDYGSVRLDSSVRGRVILLLIHCHGLIGSGE